jgi:hypothetical protein
MDDAYGDDSWGKRIEHPLWVDGVSLVLADVKKMWSSNSSKSSIAANHQ